MLRRLRPRRRLERNKGMAMKLKTSVTALLLLASLACAQSATQSTTQGTMKKKPAASPAAPTKSAAPAKTAKMAKAPAPAKAAIKTTSKATTPKAVKAVAPPKTLKAAKSPMAPKAAKPAHHAAPKTAPAAAVTSSAAAPTSASPAAVARKRDPFINPVQAVREGRGDACQGGKRCLAANEVTLRGIVKAQNGMIAVVESSAQRTYFLRENDAIYNGFVQKITPDTVTFREHYVDNLGRDAQRDIVKTVNAPVV